MKDRDGFDEKPLYISVDCLNLELLNLQKVYDRKERDKFLAKAHQDQVTGSARDIRVLLVDTSGVTEIKLEGTCPE